MSSDEMTTKPTIETVLERINEIGQQIGSLNQQVNSLNERVDSLNGRVDSLNGRVDSLAQQVTEIREIVVELRDGQEKLKAEVTAGFKRMDRKFSVLNDNILNVVTDQRDLESRVEALESK